jgi:hypothetical protein
MTPPAVAGGSVVGGSSLVVVVGGSLLVVVGDSVVEAAAFVVVDSSPPSQPARVAASVAAPTATAAPLMKVRRLMLVSAGTGSIATPKIIGASRSLVSGCLSSSTVTPCRRHEGHHRPGLRTSWVRSHRLPYTRREATSMGSASRATQYPARHFAAHAEGWGQTRLNARRLPSLEKGDVPSHLGSPAYDARPRRAQSAVPASSCTIAECCGDGC